MASGELVLMGGRSDSYKNDVWSSRDAGRMWICVVSAAPWAARNYFGASVVGESRGDSRGGGNARAVD